jgi:putative transposase
MSRIATRRSLRGAVRQLKRMNFEPIGWEDLRERSGQAVAEYLHGFLDRRVDEYLEQVRAGAGLDRRNGSYHRHLLTSVGDVEIEVPRTRLFNPVEALRLYARRCPEVDRTILAGFVFGVSTRKVAEALSPMLGERVSASTVSRIAKSLDQAVQSFHQRPLKGRYRALVFDGVYLRSKTGAGAQRAPVLVVLGILPDGRKELIDFFQARSEGEGAWCQFLTGLLERGLSMEGVEVLVVDGGTGLLAALENLFPAIPVQRCWAHKTRNILEKAKKSDQEAMKRDLRKIPNAETVKKAQSAAARFAEKWSDRCPAAVRCLQKDMDQLLVFFRFDDPDWRKQVRTTNAIERRFLEVRRRTRPMGVMADQSSTARILFAVFMHENRKQKVGTPFLLTQNS